MNKIIVLICLKPTFCRISFLQCWNYLTNVAILHTCSSILFHNLYVWEKLIGSWYNWSQSGCKVLHLIRCRTVPATVVFFASNLAWSVLIVHTRLGWSERCQFLVSPRQRAKTCLPPPSQTFNSGRKGRESCRLEGEWYGRRYSVEWVRTVDCG